MEEKEMDEAVDRIEKFLREKGKHLGYDPDKYLELCLKMRRASTYEEVERLEAELRTIETNCCRYRCPYCHP